MWCKYGHVSPRILGDQNLVTSPRSSGEFWNRSIIPREAEGEASLYSRTITSHKCAAVPRRARIEGSYTFASLNSRLETNEEEEGKAERDLERKEVHCRVLVAVWVLAVHIRPCSVLTVKWLRVYGEGFYRKRVSS